MSSTETSLASGTSPSALNTAGEGPAAVMIRRSEAAAGALSGRTSLRAEVLKHFGFRELTRLVLRHALRIDDFYQLTFNLHALPPGPPRKIGGGNLERLQPHELDSLYAQLAHLEGDDKKELLARILFFKRGFKNCYTLREGGEIGYLQWIAYPAENNVVVGAYPGRFAPLGPREVMIENAFTFPACRGRGFLRFATWQLLKQAKDEGYTRAITFALARNIDALNTFAHTGFRIQRRLREYSVCGRAWRPGINTH